MFIIKKKKERKSAESGRSKMLKLQIDRIYFVAMGEEPDLLVCRSVMAGDEEERQTETALLIIN